MFYYDSFVFRGPREQGTSSLSFSVPRNFNLPTPRQGDLPLPPPHPLLEGPKNEAPPGELQRIRKLVTDQLADWQDSLASARPSQQGQAAPLPRLFDRANGSLAEFMSQIDGGKLTASMEEIAADLLHLYSVDNALSIEQSLLNLVRSRSQGSLPSS